jgi:hypothetical protein
MQNSDQIRRNKNNNNSNKAKLRPALYERTNAGKKPKYDLRNIKLSQTKPHDCIALHMHWLAAFFSLASKNHNHFKSP